MNAQIIRNFIDANITKREKIGQLFSPAAFINDSDENIREVEKLITDCAIGGLTFFHSRQSAAANYGGALKPLRNEDSYSRLKELIQHYQSISKYPLLISIDAEWGLAMRVENTPQYPYALTLGALSQDNNELIYHVGYNIGHDCREAGIHLNLSPVVDINDNPANPVIGYRSFGENKNLVSNKALAFYRGLSAAGVAGCLKHFPGHGNTAVDSHLGLPLIDKNEDELFSNELVPFMEGIRGGVDCIMIGHLAVPALTHEISMPATLSSNIIKGILRDRLGFNGVVISDALNMQSVATIYDQKGQLELEAFTAGNDILCFSTNVPEAIDLIEKQASDDDINESFERIRNLKAKIYEKQEKGSFTSTIDEKELKEKIAVGTISVYGKRQGAYFMKSPDLARTAVVNIGKSACNQFARTIRSYRSLPQYEMLARSEKQLTILKESLLQYEQVIFAIYVPSVKPLNNYGYEKQDIEFLTSIISSIRSVVCIFGNPYSIDKLKGLEKADAVVLAYQDLPEFEKKAAELLFGEFEATGNLPVTIQTLSPSASKI